MVNKKKLNPSELLTVAQAAEILGISKVAVYKRIKVGNLKATEIAGRKLIAASELSLMSKDLDDKERDQIKKAVEQVVSQYGEVIKRLGKE